MMYVVRENGDVDELPDAVTTAIEEDQFVCLDRKGSEVRRYVRQSVLMFGYSERLKRYGSGWRWKPRRRGHIAKHKARHATSVESSTGPLG